MKSKKSYFEYTSDLHNNFFCSSTQITELSLFHDDKNECISMKMVLFNDTHIVELIFVRVKNISMKELSFCKGYIIIDGFSIHNIKKDQLELISWEIVDFENDSLHFYCEDILYHTIIDERVN